MVNGAPFSPRKPEVQSDLVVGRISDSGLQCQVSVRGGSTVVLMFAREGRGVEVAFAPRAARQITEIIEAAAKVAEGRA